MIVAATGARMVASVKRILAGLGMIVAELDPEALESAA